MSKQKLYRVHTTYGGHNGYTAINHGPKRLHWAVSRIQSPPSREETWHPEAQKAVASEVDRAWTILEEFGATVRSRPDGSPMIYIGGSQWA